MQYLQFKAFHFALHLHHARVFFWQIPLLWASLVAQLVKNLPAMQETWVQSPGWEDPLEKEMATHSSILAWKILWQRSLVDGSPWGHKESGTTERLTLTHQVDNAIPSLQMRSLGLRDIS